MASELLATYSPEDVVIVITQGTVSHVVSGYVDGTFLTITRNVPYAELYQGSDVSNMRILRRNKAATVTVSLHNGSNSNDVFSQLQVVDEQTANSQGLFSMQIKDTSGRSIYHANQCFIGNYPDSTFSNGADSRDWTIVCTRLEQTIGGNALVDPSDLASIRGLGADVPSQWIAPQ